MIPLSCSNCVHNGLQNHILGTPFGYCIQHAKVLRHSDHTTCGRHFRKDLQTASANAASERHRNAYPSDRIVLTDGEELDGLLDEYVADGAATLDSGDAVTDAVTEWGVLGTKIATLATLRGLQGARAELALLSLSRSYVRRCYIRDRKWTSGLHLLWWTKHRLSVDPDVRITDIRVQLPLPLDKQQEAAMWSLAMLRLLFLGDMGVYATDASHPVRKLGSLAADAAKECSTNYRKLRRWMRTQAVERVDSVLPFQEYRRLANELHIDRD